MDQIQQNKAALIEKINMMDFMLDSLGKVDKSKEKEVIDWTEKLSTRKLVLIEELYKLIYPPKFTVLS